MGYFIDTARALGIKSSLRPFPSLALGAFEVSLIELTSTYGTFANRGVRVEPHLVEEVRNRDGAPIERIEPRVRDAVSPQIAYLMNRVLRGVVTDGTGKAVASLGHALAGKTGTTDNNTDAWFIGYSPRLAVGVWVGFDEPRSLGSKEVGASAALPIWREFMKRALDGLPEEDFERPAGITLVAIDRATGLKATAEAGCGQVLTEAFISGTEPTAFCSVYRHRQLRMPYPLQRYALDEQGQLLLPADELDAILAHEVDVYLIDGGQRLEAHLGDEIVTLGIRILPAQRRRPLPDSLEERYDVTGWLGHDGRPARVVWLN